MGWFSSVSWHDHWQAVPSYSPTVPSRTTQDAHQDVYQDRHEGKFSHELIAGAVSVPLPSNPYHPITPVPH